VLTLFRSLPLSLSLSPSLPLSLSLSPSLSLSLPPFLLSSSDVPAPRIQPRELSRFAALLCAVRSSAFGRRNSDKGIILRHIWANDGFAIYSLPRTKGGQRRSRPRVGPRRSTDVESRDVASCSPPRIGVTFLINDEPAQSPITRKLFLVRRDARRDRRCSFYSRGHRVAVESARRSLERNRTRTSPV